MSFSSDVKNEIVSSLDTGRRQKLCYILGMLCFGGKLVNYEDSIRLRFSTENPKVARKFYTIIKNEFSIKAKLTIHKTKKSIMYMVAVDDEKYIEELFYVTGLLKRGKTIKDFISFGISPSVMSDPDYRKSFIKGAFLGGASITDPQKTSHVEFVTSHYRLSHDFVKLLEKSELNPKTVVRKSNYVIYFKNATDVGDILITVDAFDSFMEYQNIKILKDVRNNTNRKINCDSANLMKTVEASLVQVQAIEKLQRLGVLEKLSPQLQEIAKIRLEHRELNLQELGSMLSHPIGKSGVNHRLRKLIAEAEKYKD